MSPFHGGEGATLVAPATGVAPAGPALPRPTRYGGAAPVTFCRREGSAVRGRFFLQPLENKARRQTRPSGIGFAFSWCRDRTPWAPTRSPGQTTVRRKGAVQLPRYPGAHDATGPRRRHPGAALAGRDAGHAPRWRDDRARGTPSARRVAGRDVLRAHRVEHDQTFWCLHDSEPVRRDGGMPRPAPSRHRRGGRYLQRRALRRLRLRRPSS